MNNVMLDLETLDTRSSGLVLAIGATRFDLDGRIDPDQFYVCINVHSSMEAGRTLSADTLKWWLQQERAAQDAILQAFDPKTSESIVVALTKLSAWMGEGCVVWAKGPSFDVAMLENLYGMHKLSTPWKFWDVQCVRTYEKLPGAYAAKKAVVFNGTKHNALADAVYQAEVVSAIHRKLFLNDAPAVQFVPAKKTKAKAAPAKAAPAKKTTTKK